MSRLSPRDGTLGETYLDGQSSLGVIGDDGAFGEVGGTSEEQAHRSPDTDGDHAFAPVPAVVVGCLAGEDREMLLGVVVVRWVIDASCSVVEGEGSLERRAEAHFKRIRCLHPTADIDFMPHEHILRLEDLCPIEVDGGIGIEPLEEEVYRRVLKLLSGEGEGALIGPVTLTDPLDRVFSEAEVGIG